MPAKKTRATRPGLEVQRRRLLEATWRVLGRQGLDDTRVEDVLQEAGVSRQTFYRCFGSLDDAFRQVHEGLEQFLREALERALAEHAGPEGWLPALIDAVIDAAVAAGPALATIDREETRPGSPFQGTRARRQELLAALMLEWFRERYGLETENPWRIRAALMAFHQLCVAVCDGRAGAPDVARAKDAARAVAEGLLLLEGARAGLWDVAPRRAEPPRLTSSGRTE